MYKWENQDIFKDVPDFPIISRPLGHNSITDLLFICRAGALLPLPTVSAKVRAHSPVTVVIVGDECDGASQGLGQWRFAPARHLQQAC